MDTPRLMKIFAIELTIVYMIVQLMLFLNQDGSDSMPISDATMRNIGWSSYCVAVFVIMSHALSSASTELPDGRDDHFKASILIGCPLGLVMVKISGETVQKIASVIKSVAKPFLRNKFMFCFGVVTLFAIVSTGSALFSYYDGWSYLATFGTCFAQFVSGHGLCLATQNKMRTDEGLYAAHIIFLVLVFIAVACGIYAFMAPCLNLVETLSDRDDRRRIKEYARSLLPLHGRSNQTAPVRFCNCAENTQSQSGVLPITSSQTHITKKSLSQVILAETAQLHTPYLHKASFSQIFEKTAAPLHQNLTKSDLSEPIDETTPPPYTPYLTKANLSQNFIEKIHQPHRLYFKVAPLTREILHQPHLTKATLSQDVTDKIPL